MTNHVDNNGELCQIYDQEFTSTKLPYDQPRMTKPQPNDHQPMTIFFLDHSCDQFNAMTNPMTNVQI